MIGQIITLGLGSYSTSKYVITIGLLASQAIPVDGIVLASATISVATATANLCVPTISATISTPIATATIGAF